MDRITTEQLNDILTKHAEWTKSCSTEGGKANLSGVDLWGADLRNANLWHANLEGANLSDADLRCADLRSANLRGVNLEGANLSDADLRRADLRGANLRDADLRGANLGGADLRYANLWRANLRRAYLWNANLSGVDLWGADLRNADFRDANLSGADLSNACLWNANLESADLSGAKIDFPIACPEKGSFIAFKKVRDNYIVELLIPEDARRCSATSRKCRCDKAKVLSITKIDGTSDGVDTVYSKYDETFAYKIGETVEVKNFNDNRWNECSTGIHFFLTRQEAVKY